MVFFLLFFFFLSVLNFPKADERLNTSALSSLVLQCLRQQVGNFPLEAGGGKAGFFQECYSLPQAVRKERFFRSLPLRVIFKDKCIPSMPPRAQLEVESRQLGCLPSTVVSEWPFPGVLQKGLALFFSLFLHPESSTLELRWQKKKNRALFGQCAFKLQRCMLNKWRRELRPLRRDDLPCRCGTPVQYFSFDPKVWCDSDVDHLKKMNVCFLLLFFLIVATGYCIMSVSVCVWLQSMHASPTGNMKTCCKTARKFTVALL